MKTVARWLPVAALALGAWIMLADFINLRAAHEFREPTPPGQLPLVQGWGGYGWRALARLAGNAAVLAPEAAVKALETAAVRYPLDSVQWLDLAAIHARAGRAEATETALNKARAVQPYRRDALWRAAQIALQTGAPALAERQLRRWLEMFPGDTGQALFIGQRWIDSPGELLDRMLPPGPEYLVASLDVARRNGDLALAEAAWQRLDPKPQREDAAFLDYIELLLARDALDDAVALWKDHEPGFGYCRVANGSFEYALGEGLGFNWRSRAPGGVRIERDFDEYNSAPASLMIAFNGKENVALSAPWTTIPLDGGGHYELTGRWRADHLTTRALPYLQISAASAGQLARIDVPQSSFGWQTWQARIEVPEGTRLLRLQLRRDRTNNFDRNIDGRLWLDDITITPAEPPAPQPELKELIMGVGGV